MIELLNEVETAFTVAKDEQASLSSNAGDDGVHLEMAYFGAVVRLGGALGNLVAAGDGFGGVGHDGFFLAAVVVVWRLAVQDANVAILDVVVKSSQTGVRFAGIFGFDDFERVVG